MSNGGALSHAGGPEEQGGVIETVNALLRRWRLLVGLPVLAAVVTAIVTLLTPATFTATASFVPEVGRQARLPSALQGLAAQLAISTGAEPSQSPRFYADLVMSRELLERILLSQYPAPRQMKRLEDSTTLLRTLAVKGRDLADSLENGTKRLRRLVTVSVNDQTDIVTLTMDSHYPVIAAAVANRFVEYLNDFNTETRQSQARERRRFVEERVVDAESALNAAEEAVKTFYQTNRSWQQSPQLAFEEARLRRQVDMRQELYLTLEREYEKARIDEVNDTPVITVIDSAVPPRKRSRPKRTRNVVLAVFLAILAAVFLGLAAEYVERLSHENEAGYAELMTRLKQIPRDIRKSLVRTE